MSFVKLDCRILDSSLWLDRPAREVFITALLMAEPWELILPTPQLRVRVLKASGWSVPPGWYGLVRAAGTAIIRRCGIDLLHGLSALERLGTHDVESKSADFGGRRLVRIDGGFLVLNFMKYRERDETVAERVRRHREKKKREGACNGVTTVTSSASASSSVVFREGGGGGGVREAAAEAFKAANGWRKTLAELAEHFVSLEAAGCTADFARKSIPAKLGEAPWDCCDRVREAWKTENRKQPEAAPDLPAKAMSPERKAEVERIIAEGKRRFGVKS